MRKKSFIFSILFIVLASALWSEGTHDITGLSGKIQLTKGKTYKLGEIRLKADYDDLQGGKLYAASIEMKDGYKIGKSYPVSGLGGCIISVKKGEDGSHEAEVKMSGTGYLYPFMNLDLYVEQGSRLKPIENFGVSVTVIIPYKLMEMWNKTRAGKDQVIFTYIDDINTWVPIEDPSSGVKGIRRLKDRIEFTIIRWPVNDKMMSSGP